MKTIHVIIVATLVAGVSSATAPTNAVPRNAPPVLPGHIGMTEDAVARVVDFADNGKHLLTWVVTFQKKDGGLLKCMVRQGHPFLKATGLDKMRPFDLDRRSDFSGLPWFNITVGPATKEIGQLLRWEELKDGAEQGAAPLPPAPQPGPSEGAR